MSISSFINKIEKLNLEIDLQEIKKRIYSLDEKFPVNFYHGSYFDLTNIAILRDIIDERTCPQWLKCDEIQKFAIQSLSGLFFHTDVGHAFDGLLKLSQEKLPKKIRFCSNAALRGYIDSPFYIFKQCLYNQDIFDDGATVDVEPLNIFDGSEKYLSQEDIDQTGCYSEDYFLSLMNPDKPRAFLITLKFQSKPDISNCDRFSYRRENIDILNTTHIILFNLPTHYLARIMKEEEIDVLCLYESNDGDSGNTLHESLPEPLNNAKYILSGRGCVFESGHFEAERYHYDDNPHIIQNAYFRFKGYKFLGMAGKLQTGEKDRWEHELNDKYFHGTHKTDYYSHHLPIRLLFKKVEGVEPIFKTPKDYLEVSKYKEWNERLVSFQKKQEILEQKLNILDLQVPWLFLTEPTRIKYENLIKNEKHRLQIEKYICSILDLLGQMNYKINCKNRMKLKYSLNEYLVLLKKNGRPSWLVNYVDCLEKTHSNEIEIKRLKDILNF
ncbi:MAG: hypothetical protein FWG98_02485 [Candidatus Cloacimonetes bacterium]|nr:hypothetical protein [Candidatus Cloacimonadota bacterium]